MAGGQERILRDRIRAMQSTKKITRAMELIAGSRIVKAQQRVQAAVPYSEQITEVVKDLSAAGGSVDSPLLAGRDEVRTTCYVVISADRGLCGGYNAGVQRAAEGEIKADILAGKSYAIIPCGRKAEGYFKFREYEINKSFVGFSDNPTYEDARHIGEHVVDLFVSGEVDRVELVYTRFITPGSQEVVLRPLVPLSGETVAGGDGKAGSDDGSGGDYEFEPDPATLLETLLPRYVEARIYAALLNAAASEHAFRQRAMKSATDNAEELITNLSIVMNRARQDSITGEIMEIVSGSEALGNDDDTLKLVAAWNDDDDVALAASGSGNAEAASIAPAAAPAEPAAAPAAPVQQSFAGTATLERDDTTTSTPTSTGPDDLAGAISGIGPVLVGKLADLGVTTFKQVAGWSRDDIERIDDALSFKGRIDREDWVAQAKAAHLSKYGEQL